MDSQTDFNEKVIKELSELGASLQFIGFSLRSVIEVLVAKNPNLLREYFTTLEMLTVEYDKKIEDFLKKKEEQESANK